jgi:hypothetical protein
VFADVNHNARWIDNYAQTVTLPLNPAVPRQELVAIELRTNFGGGIGGDNWNVDAVVVCDNRGQELTRRAGHPFARLSGDVHTVRIPL